jgi:hypothetical protein
MSEQIEKDYNNSGKKIFYSKLNLTYIVCEVMVLKHYQNKVIKQ